MISAIFDNFTKKYKCLQQLCACFKRNTNLSGLMKLTRRGRIHRADAQRTTNPDCDAFNNVSMW